MCIGTTISLLGCVSWRMEKSNGPIVKHAGIGKASGGATISNAPLSNSLNDILSLRNWWFQNSRFDAVETNPCLSALKSEPNMHRTRRVWCSVKGTSISSSGNKSQNSHASQALSSPTWSRTRPSKPLQAGWFFGTARRGNTQHGKYYSTPGTLRTSLPQGAGARKS
jgi:hypothetical protein